MMQGMQKLQGNAVPDKKRTASLRLEEQRLAAQKRHRRVKAKMTKKSRAANRKKKR
jgi:hypothetical protein